MLILILVLIAFILGLVFKDKVMLILAKVRDKLNNLLVKLHIKNPPKA